jgi:hypothetical protein
LGLWKPLALRRIRPITELLASAIPLVNPKLACEPSIGGLDRGPVVADRAGEFHEGWELGA